MRLKQILNDLANNQPDMPCYIKAKDKLGLLFKLLGIAAVLVDEAVRVLWK